MLLILSFFHLNTLTLKKIILKKIVKTLSLNKKKAGKECCIESSIEIE